ncbi:MAG: hypothetical protein ACQEP7_03645 [bacterium]
MTLFFLLGVSSPGQSQVVDNNGGEGDSFFTSLNYPGVGAGLRTGNHSLEIKGYYDGTNYGYGPRYDYHWASFEGGSLYAGFEYLKVDFEGDISSGKGKLYGIAQGLELFFEKNYSFAIDVGPYLVELDDDDTSIGEEGTEIIMNMSLKIYF